MKSPGRGRRGVSLIELVVALLLMGVLVMAFMLSVVPVTEGLMIARRNVEAAQKAQLTVTRLVRELTAASQINSGSGNTLVYQVPGQGGGQLQRTLNWSSGGPLTLNGVPLTDDVAFFALRYHAGPDAPAQTTWNAGLPLVEFVLQSAAAGGMIYTNRVLLRNR